MMSFKLINDFIPVEKIRKIVMGFQFLQIQSNETNILFFLLQLVLSSLGEMCFQSVLVIIRSVADDIWYILIVYVLLDVPPHLHPVGLGSFQYDFITISLLTVGTSSKNHNHYRLLMPKCFKYVLCVFRKYFCFSFEFLAPSPSNFLIGHAIYFGF